MRIIYVPHALEQMERRGISEEEVAAVLEGPNEESPANFGRVSTPRADLQPQDQGGLLSG